MSWARFHRVTPSAKSWLNLSKPPPLAAYSPLWVSLRRAMRTAAARAISVDLLMDLIVFQLIAPLCQRYTTSNGGPLRKPRCESDCAWHHNKVILTSHDSAVTGQMSKRTPLAVTRHRGKQSCSGRAGVQIDLCNKCEPLCSPWQYAYDGHNITHCCTLCANKQWHKQHNLNSFLLVWPH